MLLCKWSLRAVLTLALVKLSAGDFIATFLDTGARGNSTLYTYSSYCNISQCEGGPVHVPINGTVLVPGGAIRCPSQNFLSTCTLVGIAAGSTGSDAFRIYDDSLYRNVPAEYVAMTFCDVVGYCQFAVVALENATVKIQLPDRREYTNPPCVVEYNGNEYNNTDNPNITESVPKNAVFQIQAKCDLTGTLITADKPIAVFSGSHSIVIGWGDKTDFMMEQLVPTQYWGTEYIIYPYPASSSGDIVSIVALKGDTEVRITGYGQYVLKKPRQFIRRRIDGNRPVKIWASKIVSVAQYILDLDREASAMVIVTPLTQYTNESLVGNDAEFYLITNSLVQLVYNDNLQAGIPDVLSDSKYSSSIQVVKKSEYTVAKFVYKDDEEATLISSLGKFGGYILKSNSTSRTLMATTLGFCFKNQKMSTQGTHAPGDGIDNDRDGEVDEDSCTIDDWNNHGNDCSKLGKDEGRDSWGNEFLIPLINKAKVSQSNFKISVADIVTLEIGAESFEGSGSHSNPDSTYLIHLPKQVEEFAAYYIDEETGSVFSPFPVDTLSLEYFALTHCPHNICTFACTVAAFYNDTDVFYTTMTQNNTERRNLNTREAFSFNDTEDLSGTYIMGSKPIAVTCGGILSDGSVSQLQLPPVDSWGNEYRVVFRTNDTGALRIVAGDGNKVVLLTEYEYESGEEINFDTPTNLSANYLYRSVFRITDPGEVRHIEITQNIAYVINATKPVLVVFLPDIPPYPIILVTSVESTIKDFKGFPNTTYLYPTTRPYVLIDDSEFFLPYVILDGDMTSWWMRLNSTVEPFEVTEQRPGDMEDNDGDGLIDEDFCGFLITELDGKAFLFDIDLDGAINEDCRGCGMGEELDEDLTCSPCEIGLYRDEDYYDKCIDCGNKKTTFHEGSNSSAQCVDVCLEGYEYNRKNEECEMCRIGYYKELNSSVWKDLAFENRWMCKKCPDRSPTTLYDGSTALKDCIGHCKPGKELKSTEDGRRCENCAIGWFKNTSSESLDIPANDRWNCTKCPDNFTTLQVGSSEGSHCVPICEDGKELDGQECKPCKIGYYRNRSEDMEDMKCKKCNGIKKTLNVGSNSSDMCIDFCVEGMELVSNGQGEGCQPCRYGWYKNTSSESLDIPVTDRWYCTKCPDNLTTLNKGSNESSDCVPLCEDGEELEPYGYEGQCQHCKIGYYRNASEDTIYGRMKCKQCEESKTTMWNGTKSSHMCIEDCTEGMEFVSNGQGGECKPCRYGWYKSTSSKSLDIPTTDRWNCTKCPDTLTTLKEGSKERSDCVPLCEDGEELEPYGYEGQCQPCKIGYYRNASEDTIYGRMKCKQCEESKTTIWNGTKSSHMCIEDCTEGMEFVSNGQGGECKPCRYGWYKNTSSKAPDIPTTDRWNCTKCPDTLTTLKEGSKERSDCVQDCGIGEQYNATTEKCDACPLGSYKSVTGSLQSCTPCPDNYTTSKTGSQAEKACKPVNRKCKCPCSLVNKPKNFTDAEKKEILEGHKKDLQIDKSKLSSALRKKISVMERRPEAQALGGVGVAMLVLAFSILIILDFPALVEASKMFCHNIRAAVRRLRGIRRKIAGKIEL